MRIYVVSIQETPVGFRTAAVHRRRRWRRLNRNDDASVRGVVDRWNESASGRHFARARVAFKANPMPTAYDEPERRVTIAHTTLAAPVWWRTGVLRCRRTNNSRCQHMSYACKKRRRLRFECRKRRRFFVPGYACISPGHFWRWDECIRRWHVRR